MKATTHFRDAKHPGRGLPGPEGGHAGSGDRVHRQGEPHPAPRLVAGRRQGESGLRMTRIGVLALQGAFREHVHALRRTGRRRGGGAAARGTRRPGRAGHPRRGEHHGRQAHGDLRADRALARFVAERPVLGTCAGLILLARRTTGDEQPLLGRDGRRGAPERLRASGALLRKPGGSHVSPGRTRSSLSQGSSYAPPGWRRWGRVWRWWLPGKVTSWVCSRDTSWGWPFIRN